MLKKKSILAALRRDARKVLRELKLPKAEVQIELLSDREMRFLEKRYLKKNKRKVDVLSFPHVPSFPHPETRGRYVGEVYVNWDVNGEKPEELRRLLIHGILHLAGYDHDERRATIETKRMERLEERLCSVLQLQRHSERGAKRRPPRQHFQKINESE